MADRLVVDVSAEGAVAVNVLLDGDLVGSPAGEPFELQIPIDADVLSELRWYLEEYLQVPFGVYEDRGPSVAASLEDWGETLFGAVFGSGPAREAYLRVRARQAVGTELYVRSAVPAVLGLPWELMRDPERTEPLALTFAAMGRMLPAAALADSLAVQGEGLRVLMVIARPAGVADVGYQMIARPLLERLDAVRGRVELEVLRPPTLEALQVRLAAAVAEGRPFQMVHFDGHGVLRPGAKAGGGEARTMYATTGAEGVVLFEDDNGGGDPVPAGVFATAMLEGQVPVVVLNACQSGALGDEAKAAIATRLLMDGMSSVVAMGYSVYAVAAAEFMTAFYETLFSGETVAAAVRRGRLRMQHRPQRPSPKGELPLEDWMVPVHYLRREVAFPHLRRQPSLLREDGRLSLDVVLDRLRPGETTQTTPTEDPLAPVGRFVGRDAAFYLLELIARTHRVVVLHGPGGTGKTELVKAFGRWWRDTGALDHPDGVLFHSFEPGIATFGLDGVITGIGLRLFGPDFAVLEPAQRRAAVLDALRTHRLLLVWDNFESVHSMPDPDQATPPLVDDELDDVKAFVEAFGASGGKSTLVITSRTTEDWLGDLLHLPLGGLLPHEVTEYADELLRGYPQAQLRRQQRACAELVQWLGGHPLAMRLILPQLEDREPADLLKALQGHGELPAGFEPDAGRNESLAVSVLYSLRHLEPTTQRLLPALSLFESVADIDVLANVAAVDGVPERFAGVDRAGWERACITAAAVGLLTPLGAGMYRLHPALPAYLTALWRNDQPGNYQQERDAAEQALLPAYAAFGEWLRGQIGTGDAGYAFALIEIQLRSFGRVLGYALDRQRWALAQAVLQPVDEYWDARGLYEEARHWVDRIRLATEQPDGTPPSFDSNVGALWLFAVGSQAGRDIVGRRLDQAHETYDTIRAVLEAAPADDVRDTRLAVACHQLGIVAQLQGDFDRADHWYHKSLAIKEQLGDRPGMASSYHQLARVAQERGDFGLAKDRSQKALTISEQVGDRPGMANCYHQLGIISQLQGDLGRAEDWYEKALIINEQLGDRPAMANTYHQLGIVSQWQGDLGRAEDWYHKSLTIEEQLGNRPGMATSYAQLGVVSQLREDFDLARDWYRKALTIEEQLGNRPGMAKVLASLAVWAELQNREEEALGFAIRAVALFDSFPHPSTDSAPGQLVRLTRRYGEPTLSQCWLETTGQPVPDQVLATIRAALAGGES
jgi:tetratricopeptide (TPR) repeat protein